MGDVERERDVAKKKKVVNPFFYIIHKFGSCRSTIRMGEKLIFNFITHFNNGPLINHTKNLTIECVRARALVLHFNKRKMLMKRSREL